MKPQAFGDKIVITLKEAATKIGSIVVPGVMEGDKMKNRGIVVSFGADVEGIEVGQEVLFNAQVGAFIEDGVQYSVTSAENILVVV